jgi:cell division protein FtsB
MATEVATLTFKADTADLDRAEKALDGVAASGKRAQSSTDNFSKATEQSGKSMKNMRGIAGQLGFQVQDIAVQLQSGTNAMIVFGQQGSQIAGAFGPGGAIVGAVIAVGAAIGTALVAHFGNGTQSAKDLRAEIEELTEDFDKLGDAARTVYIRELAAQMAEAEEQIQNTTEALKEANNALRDPAALEAANMLNPYVDMLVEARVKQQDLAKAEEDQIAVLEALKEK